MGCAEADAWTDTGGGSWKARQGSRITSDTVVVCLMVDLWSLADVGLSWANCKLGSCVASCGL